MPVGDTLKNIAHIDLLGRAPVLAGAKLRVLCDVRRTLCGGAAGYGQQAAGLDEGLAHLAAVAEADLGVSIRELPGGGAAGGMGAGAVAFLGGELCQGTEMLLDLVNFDELLADASLVLTGEGCIDAQTAQGKVVAGGGPPRPRRRRAGAGFCRHTGRGAPASCTSWASPPCRRPTGRGCPLSRPRPAPRPTCAAPPEDACRLLELRER